MQGKRNSQMPLFVSGNLSDFVPREHLLRKVDTVLDLCFVRRLTKKFYCQNNGRPSLDPIVYFKLQVIAYLYGIKSDRQLCEEIQYNMAYRWYLGYPLDEQPPNHSTLTRTRDRLGEETFRKVFEKILKNCQKVGLVRGQQIISDASLIKADASKNSLVPRNPDEKFDSKKKKSNKNHVSKSDPESTMVGRNGYGNKLYYKVHSSIDAKSRVITDCYITTGATHECNILNDRIDFQKRKLKLPIKEVIADSGYGHGPTYKKFAEQRVKTYIPLRDKKLGKGKNSAPDNFKFDRANNRYICVGDQGLYPHKPSVGFVRYRVTNGACKDCALKGKCFENQTTKDRPRYVNRSFFQDTFDHIRKRMDSKVFKEKMVERAWKIEGIFGEAKTNHGLSRAKYRGRSKTQIQLYMISSVQNLKRLLGHFSQQFSEILSSLMQLEVIKIKISIASSFLTAKFIKNQNKNQNWLNSIIRRVYQQAERFIEQSHPLLMSAG